jgi:Spy/CpxP family protein refolding chaperone
MTTCTRRVKQAGIALVTITLAIASVSAQAPPPQAGQAPQRQGNRPGGPRGPAAPGELNLQTVQNLVDAWALVEAEKDLELTNTQYSDFVARMQRVQSTRRRHMMERQRMLREMNGMLFGNPRPDDAAINEKLKAFDQLTERSAQEMRQVVQDLDGILTPYQRARFRLFEERMERRKLELLTRARAGRGGGDGTAATPPGKGRGGL